MDVRGEEAAAALAGGAGAARSDEVDEVVDAWRRERPDLDPAPLHVMSRVTRLVRRVDRLRAEALGAHGLVKWEFDVLSALRRAGEPYRLSVGALMRDSLVASATITHRIDRLAGRGFVERESDPGDRRGVLVALCPPGRQAVDGALAALLERERALLEVLDAGQQEELGDLLRVLLASVER